ncbi:MAG: PP2C family protein-serine/threonine phosphatase, partial [Myxococcota bacterium]
SCTGGRRDENEDAFGVSNDGVWFVVADGCGGRSSGRRASDLAVQCILASERDPDDKSVAVADPLAARVLEANDIVFRAARQDPALVGVGCALAALRLGKGYVAIVHVGHCRVGRLGNAFAQRGDGDNPPELRWLTLHHVLWVEALLAGRPQAEVEELRSTHASVIMRAVGVTDSLDVEVQYRGVQPGDLFLLCTDGLSAHVPQQTITGILRSPASLAERCAALLEAAEAAGGYDNTTVILVEASRVVPMHGQSLTK